MHTLFDGVGDGITRALEYLIAAMLVVITGLVFVNVLTRYVFLYSIIWSEEVARFTFIWLIFLGTAVAIKRKAHFHLTLLDFPEGSPARMITQAIGALAVVSLSYVLLTQGATLVQSTMRQSSPNIGVPMGYAYMAVPISGALIIFFLGLDLLAFFARRGGRSGGPRDQTNVAADAAER